MRSSILRRSILSLLATSALVTLSSSSFAATITVGPTGKMFTTVKDALAASNDGDEIDVDAGTYMGDTAQITHNGITIKGVGGMVVLDLTGAAITQSKGILLVSGENVTLENIEFVGAEISAAEGENGAGIRMEGHSLVVRGCSFHDNQDGILATPLGEGGTLLIESSEFRHNGLGNGCSDGNGCTHNMYIRELDSFTIQYSWTHDVVQGHLIKSRARKNIVQYNRIGSEGNGTSSIEVNLCEGGESYVVGNVIQKDSDAGNPNLLTFGDDKLGPNGNDLFIVGNTFVTAHQSSTFVLLNMPPTKVVMNDNIFAGPGTVLAGMTPSADNWVGMDPGFADEASYDFHLTMESPAIGIAVDPGSGPDMSLSAAYEYVHPLSSVPRSSEHDAGAFEFMNLGTGGSGGTSSGAGGTGTAGTSSTGGSGTAGSGGTGTAGTSSAGAANAGSGGTTSSGGTSANAGSTGNAGTSATTGHSGSGGTSSAGHAGSGGTTSHSGTGGTTSTAGAANAGSSGASGSPNAPADQPAADSGDSGGCGCSFETKSNEKSFLALGALGLAAVIGRKLRRRSQRV